MHNARGELRRIWTLRRRVNKGKRKGRVSSIPAPLQQQAYYYTTIVLAVDVKGGGLASPTTSAQALSASLSDSLGRHPRVNPRRHILGGGSHEREHRAIRGDEHVPLRSGTILKGDRACAIRLDRIRPRAGLVTKSLPVKVT